MCVCVCAWIAMNAAPRFIHRRLHCRPIDLAWTFLRQIRRHALVSRPRNHAGLLAVSECEHHCCPARGVSQFVMRVFGVHACLMHNVDNETYVDVLRATLIVPRVLCVFGGCGRALLLLLSFCVPHKGTRTPSIFGRAGASWRSCLDGSHYSLERTTSISCRLVGWSVGWLACHS